MTLLRINILVCLVLFSSFSFGQVPNNSADNETNFLLNVTKAVEPSAVSVMDLVAEVPDGGNNGDINPECDPKHFENDVLSKKRTTAEYFKLAREYFARCQGELTQNSLKGVMSLAKFALYDYQFLQHPQIKLMTITLSNGTQVPAIVALKQDPHPRPLVVMKCGVFCAAGQSPAMKNYVMHLFDQGPFNLVMLANQTGLDYLYANESLSLGGWGEGFEVVQVGKWLKEKWEYKDRISSMHLMGMSLGGNAAAFGASYNDLYPMGNGKKVYNSVTAICPVLSLRPTLEHLYESTPVGNVFTQMTKNQFAQARDHLTDIPDLLADDKFPKKKSLFPDYIGSIASTSLQRRGIASTPADFFRNNNFWNLENKVKTPMLVWASKDDVVVNNKINAQVMEHDDYYENSPNVGVLNLTYGSHCAFGAAYGLQAAAVVLRSFVLAHSPEYVETYKLQQMPWSFGFKKVYQTLVHVGQTWKFDSQSDKVKVSFRLFNWQGGKDCYEKGPWKSNGQCVLTRDFEIPIASLKEMGARVPRSQAEAQALTREFNAKVEFLSKGHTINGTSASDFAMSWRTEYE